MVEAIDEKQQEILFKLSMFEQQIRALQEQLKAVEDSSLDMNILNLGLDELRGGKDKEILAPLGRGIFVKAKLTSEDLIVDVGGKNLVNKNIEETKEIIQEQIIKLEKIKHELNQKLVEVDHELMSTIEEAQRPEED